MDVITTLVSVALTAAVVIPLIVVIVLVRQLLAIARAARDGRVDPSPDDEHDTDDYTGDTDDDDAARD